MFQAKKSRACVLEQQEWHNKFKILIKWTLIIRSCTTIPNTFICPSIRSIEGNNRGCCSPPPPSLLPH